MEHSPDPPAFLQHAHQPKIRSIIQRFLEEGESARMQLLNISHLQPAGSKQCAVAGCTNKSSNYACAAGMNIHNVRSQHGVNQVASSASWTSVARLCAHHRHSSCAPCGTVIVDGPSCCHNCYSMHGKGNKSVDRHCSECETLLKEDKNQFEAFVFKGLQTLARMHEVRPPLCNTSVDRTKRHGRHSSGLLDVYEWSHRFDVFAGSITQRELTCLQGVTVTRHFLIKCGDAEVCDIDACLVVKVGGVVKLRIFGEIDGTKHVLLANNKDEAAMLAAAKFCADRNEAFVFIRSRHAIGGISDERARNNTATHFVHCFCCAQLMLADAHTMHCTSFVHCACTARSHVLNNYCACPCCAIVVASCHAFLRNVLPDLPTNSLAFTSIHDAAAWLDEQVVYLRPQQHRRV
jgi:hypothetical protein